MDLFEQALGDIQGGVLDVATGQGSFVEILADRLGRWAELILEQLEV